ncbi:MAG: hypothetical protein R3B74_05720 [Nitrospirales bacterium]|nr:hypothetical protein [Nitrospirales bacterium]
MSFLAWAGTLASLGGAVASLWQASQARTAASEAIRIRAQLVDHRKASELASMQATCKKAQKSMEKYGPGSVPSSLWGISPNNDAADVQEFLINLKEQRAHFGTRHPNEADQFCDVLTPLLDNFAQATSPELLREYGKQIVVHLSSISAAIKKQLDGKREKTQ